MSGCNICSNYSCESCNNKSQEFKPTLTVARACELIHMLLGTQKCGTICPDWELCKLLRLYCMLNCGKIQLAGLAMLVAASILETEALEYARSGRFKTLTIEIQADRTAKLLTDQAKVWKSEAMLCTGIPKFHIARTGRGCGAAIMHAYKGCHTYEHCSTDEYKLVNCEWDCCEDCDDIVVIPATDTEPEMLEIPEGRFNVPL